MWIWSNHGIENVHYLSADRGRAAALSRAWQAVNRYGKWAPASQSRLFCKAASYILQPDLPSARDKNCCVMGAKKYHRKSKLGCTTCRQRRVKCDETQGGCLRCQKRNYPCSLRSQQTTPGPNANNGALRLVQHAVLAPSLTEPHFTNALLQPAILNRLPRSVRPYAGRLFHQFASNTVTTMGHGTTVQQAWCTAIPSLALKHEFVAHGVLAITALHISTTLDSKESSRGYVKMAALELNMGLKKYMEELQRISQDNVEALFAFSTALSLCSTFQAIDDCRQLVLGRSRFALGQTRLLDATLQIICHTLRTIRGAQVILVPGWSTLQGGPMRSIVERESWDDPPPVSSAHLHEDRKLAILESMWSSPRRPYEDHFSTLRQNWQSLRATFKIVWSLKDKTPHNEPSHGPSFDWTSVFNYMFKSTAEYVDLIEKLSIEAWVLAAHFGCLCAEVEGLWWFGHAGPVLVTTAALIVGAENWEWIAWPTARVGLDLESLRPLALDRPKVCP